MTTTGRVVQEIDESEPEVVKVDDIGVGGGVTDRLVELEKPVLGLNAGAAAMDSEHFLNARAEWYWGLRLRFQDGDIDIDEEDEDLAAQLTALKFKPNSRGQIQIESKEDLKKRGVPSPNRADAVMMAFAAVALDLEQDLWVSPEFRQRISPV